jgi:NADH:ubiquinone oxidoreductase subunit F (NADH-binding)
MPPKLETNGLDDRPTLVSNVETFAWVPYILLNGGEAYAALGTNGWKGKRFFSVSGDVISPGVYEVPMGLTLRELIFGQQYCRGIPNGKHLKAIAPSGPSGGFLPAKLTAQAGLPPNHAAGKAWQALAKRRGSPADANELDVLDLEVELNLFRSLSPTQALGSGIVVYAEGRDMIDQAVNAVEFFRNESCGKCVPCRVGSQKFAAAGANLLQRRMDSDCWYREMFPMLTEVAAAMELTSICALGRSVALPMRTALQFFADDLSSYLASSKTANEPKPNQG